MSDTPTVAQVLADLAGWRAEAQAQRTEKIGSYDTQVTELQSEIAALTGQLEALREQVKIVEEDKLRLSEDTQSLEQEEATKANGLLIAALQKQASSLGTREASVARAGDKIRGGLEAMLREKGLGDVYDEYQGYKSTEASLANIPDSYRALLMKHRDEQEALLRGPVEEALRAPIQVDDPALNLDLVIAVDDAESPVIVHVLLPLNADRLDAWESKEEGLQSWVSYRAAQAVFEFGKSNGQVPTVESGNYMDTGLFIMESQFAGSEDPGDALEASLRSVFSGAPELQGAKVNLTVNRVSLDYLMPFFDEEDENVA